MRFSFKVFISTVIVLAFALGISAYLLISASFESAINRQIQSALAENQALRYTFDTSAQNIPKKDEEPGEEVINEILAIIDSSIPNNGRTLSIYESNRLSVINSGNSMTYTLINDELRQYIEITGPIYIGEKTKYLRSVHNISEVFQQRDYNLMIYRRLTAAVLLVSSVFMYVIAFWLTRPVRKMSQASKEIARGEFDRRIKGIGDDELGDLARDFNYMAESLEQQVLTLEENIRQREDFVASFAHELKTPLTSIIGYADMMRSREMDLEMQFMTANYIFREGRRLESLSLKLMELIVLNRQEFELKEVSVKGIFKSIQEIFRPFTVEMDFKINMQCDKSVLMMEPDLMKTCIINLIDNARKASDKGGIIYLLGKREEEGYSISVQDFGRGIPAEDMMKITEAFYMVDKSRARLQNGAGLGLSLCKKIAEIHNAEVQFESQVDRGTKVTLLFKEAGVKSV